MGRAGEGLPGLDEMEVIIVGALGMLVAYVLILKANLSVEEGGFESNEAGLAPSDAGDLVDEGFLHVVFGEEGCADAYEVLVERGFVFDGDDGVDDGGEAVGEGILAGAGLTCDGGGAFGVGSVAAGLFGAGEFLGHVGGNPFDLRIGDGSYR